jgi:hypothetical protein
MKMIKGLETRTDKEKKQRTRNIIIGVVIVALMVLSTLGYVIVDRTGQEEQNANNVYNGFKFIDSIEGWQTTIGTNVITMSYLPQEVFDYNSTGVTSSDLYGFTNKVVYISISDEQQGYASIDLARNLKLVALRVQFACPIEAENSSFCQDNNLPIKGCDDASLDSKIIVFKNQTNQTLASYEYKDSCLVIKGQGSETTKASDNFIYKLFGVL